MTTPNKKVSIASIVARFLTVLCFFNFAGVNNGYTAMMAARPDPVQSVSFTARFMLSSFSTLRAPALETLRSGQKMFLDLVSRASRFPLSARGKSKTAADSFNRSRSGQTAGAASFSWSVEGSSKFVSFRQENALEGPKWERSYDANRIPFSPPVMQSRPARFLKAVTTHQRSLRRNLHFSAEGDGDGSHLLNASPSFSPIDHSGASTRVVFLGRHSN